MESNRKESDRFDGDFGVFLFIRVLFLISLCSTLFFLLT